MLFAASANAQSAQELQLQLDLNDVSDTLILSRLPFESNHSEGCDTIITQRGKAERRLPIAAPCYLLIKKPYHGGGIIRSASIIAVPGERISMKGTMTNPVWEGTGIYRSILPSWELMSASRAKIQAIYEQFQRDSKNADSQQKEALRQKAEAANNAVTKEANMKAMAWIKAHPAEQGAAVLLPTLEKNDLNKALKVIDATVRNGALKGLIDATINRQRQKENFEVAKTRIQSGQTAPAFTLKDISGRDFSLSTLRGRYVILDFWGSWCGSCIKGMPKMKEYYARYKDRFEIVGVDCSDTEAKWKAAVKEHALPWIHVFNGPTDGVDTRYAVNAYPTKILINPDGTINRVIVGESEEFYQYLDQLFKP